MENEKNTVNPTSSDESTLEVKKPENIYAKLDSLKFDEDGEQIKFAEPFETHYNNKLPEGEVPFANVVGHENQKKELLNVVSWFKNSKELKAKGVSIPKGVILFGEPGNGKSLLMKEIIRCAEAPVFVFKCEKEFVADDINRLFKKARETGHAIIIIDELDLLINRERRVVRALQENLDGVESSDDLLVITATNDLDEIPDALTRNGRLEKLIHIPFPTAKEAVELLKKHFDEFGVKLPDDFDEFETGLMLNRISCAAIKAIVNDVVLRNGFENIKTSTIDDSIYNITNRVKSAPEEDNLSVAIHEAGHACVANSFSKYFTINRLNISGASGEFHAKEVEKNFWPYQKAIADIKISMAGVLAQKVICGEGTRGCENDLQRARNVAYNLFNMSGYSSAWETLPSISDRSRRESQIKLRKNERKIEALLRKCEKETIAFIKAHKSQISALGQLLFEKKHLKSSEILSIIG